MNILNKIQTQLESPKNQTNAFGKYKYRSCEDILASLKPLLLETKTTLIISDEIIEVGHRIYVKATATLKGEDGKIIETASASAREPEMKKGMDEAQITGATSSYARKYALNGLFAIDDTKDADTMDNKNSNEPEKKSDPEWQKNIDEFIALYNTMPAPSNQLRNYRFAIYNDSKQGVETALLKLINILKES